MSIDKIISLCKRRGFIFQSSENYGGFGAEYDYGPLGTTLKNNISEEFLQSTISISKYFLKI